MLRSASFYFSRSIETGGEEGRVDQIFAKFHFLWTKQKKNIL